MFKLYNVEKIAQKKDRLCWYASAQMLKSWGKAHGKTFKPEPAELTAIVNKNEPIHTDPDTFKKFGNAIGLRKIDFDERHTKAKGMHALLLSQNSPIWYCGENDGWNKSTVDFHVVVITGIVGDILHFNDPWPVGIGNQGTMNITQFFKQLDVLVYPWAALVV